MTPKTKKIITGVTISDDKLKASHDMKRLVRSMIHKAIISGDYSEINRIRGYIAYISSIEHDYKEKITKYINKFYTDPITLFNDAINSFNSNKIFSSLEDLIEKEPSYFVEGDEIDLFESYAYGNRQEYLEKHGYVAKTTKEIINFDEEDIPF